MEYFYPPLSSRVHRVRKGRRVSPLLLSRRMLTQRLWMPLLLVYLNCCTSCINRLYTWSTEIYPIPQCKALWEVEPIKSLDTTLHSFVDCEAMCITSLGFDHQDITIYIILLSVYMHSGYEEPSSSRIRMPTCFTTCWMKFLQRVWPMLRWCLTFTIPNKGIFGTVFQLLGCLLAYLSAITISYQVYRHIYIATSYSLKQDTYRYY